MNHGTDTGYKKHHKDAIPFPEDEGGISCGCQMAHRLACYDYRARNDVHHMPCATCGACRDIRPGRDGQCAECWQRAEARRRSVEQMAEKKRNESAAVLVYGRWVRDGLIVRWRGYGETA